MSISRYLAVVTALTTEADYVFYPESPPPIDWPEKLCKKLSQVFTIHSIIKSRIARE